MSGEAFVQLGTVYFDTEIRAREMRPCRRCMAPVDVVTVFSEPFELDIPPGGDSVDPLPTVLQMIDAVRDPHVLCRSSCRGLCPHCGADRNQDPEHRCPEAEDDRRTLRDLMT